MGQGQIKVATVLGDNMVLQRNTEVKIWGKAMPGEKLTVKADWVASQAFNATTLLITLNGL